MRLPFFPARQSAAGIEPQLFHLSMEHTDVLDSICLLVAALPLTLFLRGVPHPMNAALALIPLAPALARAAVIARLKYRWRHGLRNGGGTRFWARALGTTTILFGACVGAANLGFQLSHDFAGARMSTLVIYTVCAAQAARMGPPPWIAQASLLAMFGCLIAGGLLVNTLAVMWPGLLLVGFFAYTLCVAETRKYNMVVEHLHTRAHLRALAEQDSLTGLANRHHFDSHLLVLCMARPKNFALVLIDLDRFKAVNDTRGHAAGDALMRAAASRLRALCREGDFIARIGGDEFAILLQDDGAGAQLAARIEVAMSTPFMIEGSPACIGASTGHATAAQADFDPKRLMQIADMAMYRQKAAHRAVEGQGLCPWTPLGAARPDPHY